MRRLPVLTGRTFGYLTVVRPDTERPGYRYVCLCKCGNEKSVSACNLRSGHTKSCGCYNKERLSEVHTGNKWSLGITPKNFKDLTGMKFGGLTVVRREDNVKHLTRWLCQCQCGNTSVVYSCNLLLGKSKRCQSCCKRIDITGEKVGLLTAESCEEGPVKGRPPLWTFRCQCGNTIQATVREFRAQWIRSCGCHGNSHASWSCMMGRCYTKENNRFKYYGARGIKVCERWHTFKNFLEDMGECPKRHTLSRKNCEKDYFPENCIWEHITKNTADTYFGKPTRPGRAKGAKRRY